MTPHQSWMFWVYGDHTSRLHLNARDLRPHLIWSCVRFWGVGSLLFKCHPLNTKSNSEISCALFYYSLYRIYGTLPLNNELNSVSKFNSFVITLCTQSLQPYIWSDFTCPWKLKDFLMMSTIILLSFFFFFKLCGPSLVTFINLAVTGDIKCF